MKVVFHADDFGLTGAVNAGILEAHERGVLASASIMVTAPAAEAAVAAARARPTLDCGLHVTLVSGLAAWLVAFFWRRVAWLAVRAPARKAAALAAVFAALGYTLLAGYGVPAQRTFWMVTVFAAALWTGRIASPCSSPALQARTKCVGSPRRGSSNVSARRSALATPT